MPDEIKTKNANRSFIVVSNHKIQNSDRSDKQILEEQPTDQAS